MLWFYRCVITHDSLLLFSFVCSILSKITLYCPANRAELDSLGRTRKSGTGVVSGFCPKKPKPNPAKAAYQDLRFALRYLPSNIENDARTAIFPGNAAARSHTVSFEREDEESFSLEHSTSYMTAFSAESSQLDQ